MARRLRALSHGSWTAAMVTLMAGRKYFRWHDSGDLQGAQHLKNILEVCKQTPDTKHWLPTREAKLLQYLDPDVIPTNLLIRLSATKVDGAPSQAWPWTSTVVTNRGSRTCPAPTQGGKCIDCRQCWDRTVWNCAIPALSTVNAFTSLCWCWTSPGFAVRDHGTSPWPSL